MTEAEWIALFRRPEIPAFNAAMLEHPDADLPRLVFADWVEENCPNTPFVAALRRSIANPQIPEWVPNFSMVVRGHELRLWRGRLEIGIDFSDREFEAEPDAFVRAAWDSSWVGRLKLRGLKDHNCSLHAFAGKLGGVEWLDLFDSGVGLLDSPFWFWRNLLVEFAKLIVLDLRLSVVTAHEAEILASAPVLSGLTAFRFTDTRLTDTARRLLAESKTLPEHIRVQFRRPM